MKKLSLKRFRKQASEQIPSRITNETVAEHRERILAGGRRFKYPIQYARHKLVINAMLISLAALLLLAALGWWQLYIVQNSSSLMYRLTRIFPLPVASVDGEATRFSDYLVRYSGSKYYLSKYDEIKIDSPDGRAQLAHIKRESLSGAELNAYAAKLARQRGIVVTDKDIDQVIAQQRNTANGPISQETYDASLQQMYNWSPDDYRQAVKRNILRARVSFAVDEKADQLQQKAAQLLRGSGDLAKVAAELGDVGNGQKASVQVSGLVYNTSLFYGVAVSQVAELPVNGISGVIKSTTDDGYYFVKVIEKNDKQVNFAFIRIPLTEFSKQFDQLRASGKIKEYIAVPKQ